MTGEVEQVVAKSFLNREDKHSWKKRFHAVVAVCTFKHPLNSLPFVAPPSMSSSKDGSSWFPSPKSCVDYGIGQQLLFSNVAGSDPSLPKNRARKVIRIFEAIQDA